MFKESSFGAGAAESGAVPATPTARVGWLATGRVYTTTSLLPFTISISRIASPTPYLVDPPAKPVLMIPPTVWYDVPSMSGSPKSFKFRKAFNEIFSVPSVDIVSSSGKKQ